ncbi:hypothetical protein UCMB321_3550 [Pseudomonas batumici]|uniref:Uncharacterized protein n=1 Tax=Pseudomonas batumici TaxID=226910 RepID=A0A0C2EVN8_9PSED|nr:hypothetical protein UCMB321_3550 [Pseudomonas batumici]
MLGCVHETPHKPLSRKRMRAQIEPREKCCRLCYTHAVTAWHRADKSVQCRLCNEAVNHFEEIHRHTL